MNVFTHVQRLLFNILQITRHGTAQRNVQLEHLQNLLTIRAENNVQQIIMDINKNVSAVVQLVRQFLKTIQLGYV